MTRLMISFVAISFFAPAVFAHDMPTISMPKEFESMKKLVGTWEGTTQMEGKDVTTTTQYSLTSNNSVLMERLGVNSPHEMVNMYHKDGKTIGMTHYCGLGNRPYMKLIKTDEKTFTFEMPSMTKANGVDSPKEMHMHKVIITMADPDTLKEEWTSFANGKAQESAVFTFKRKK